jgi:tetratricopeptide (TPR) repeat protein
MFIKSIFVIIGTKTYSKENDFVSAAFNLMSLLADLLSKTKQPQTKRDVPPNLKNIVQVSARKSDDRRRMILLSVLFAAAVLTGVFFVYLTRALSDRSASNISISPREKVSMAENQRRGEEGLTPEHPEISKFAETVQHPESKEAIQNKEAGNPAVAASKKHENISHPAPITESSGKDVLPDLEQVIVKKGSPDKTRNESEIDAYLYSARESEMKNDYQGALTDYKKALAIDKNNYIVMNNIAFIYLTLGIIEESVNYSQMALGVNKDYVPALINLGIASAKSGDMPDAEKYFNQALKLDPDNKNALLNLALFYELQMNYPGSAEYFSRLAKAGDLSGTLGLARVYEKQDKTEEALKLYRTAFADSSLDDKTRSEVRQRIIVLSGKMQNP